jgi:hypothetical protein
VTTIGGREAAGAVSEGVVGAGVAEGAAGVALRAAVGVGVGRGVDVGGVPAHPASTPTITIDATTQTARTVSDNLLADEDPGTGPGPS